MKVRITTALPLRLNPSLKQVNGLNTLFNEYRKAVNFFIRKIPLIKSKNPKLTSNEIRKQLYATLSRRRGKYDVRDSARLPKTYYSMAFRFANDLILKSGSRERWKRERVAERIDSDIQKWEEVLVSKKITREVNGKKVRIDARVIIPQSAKRKKSVINISMIAINFLKGKLLHKLKI
jgi:hypothetical protein